MAVPLVLASASPARRATLIAAGIEAIVIVSDVDEDALLAGASFAPADAVLELARAKARDVAHRKDTPADAVVLGCDSMLEFDGQILGKPGDPATATRRWEAMRGQTGVLHTGHWVVGPQAQGERAERGATGSTVVRFANVSDAEIAAYVATGEPLVVAGAFTIDGRGGPFVESIEGDYHNVVGLSLPLLRRLLGELGMSITDLWNRAS